MSKSLKSICAIAAVMVFCLTSTALSSTPCANLMVSITPNVVAPGGTITVSTSITNCSDARERVKVKTDISTPFGSFSLSSATLVLDAGETRSASVTYTVPAFVPAGTYTVTATAYSGTTVLATSTATLTVS